MFVLAEFSAPLISQIYVGYDEDVFNLSVHALRMYAFGRTFVFQTILILVLPLFLGTEGLWLAQAATELLSVVIVIFLLLTLSSYH